MGLLSKLFGRKKHTAHYQIITSKEDLEVCLSKAAGDLSKLILDSSVRGKDIRMQVTVDLVPRQVPKGEEWLHKEPVKSQLERAVEWAETHEPEETDVSNFIRRNRCE
jgi:hypothetical protein